MNRFCPLILLAALAACGGAGDKAEQSADQLEKAAAQSDPTSAALLDNAADQVRETIQHTLYRLLARATRAGAGR